MEDMSKVVRNKTNNSFQLAIERAKSGSSVDFCLGMAWAEANIFWRMTGNMSLLKRYDRVQKAIHVRRMNSRSRP